MHTALPARSDASAPRSRGWNDTPWARPAFDWDMRTLRSFIATLVLVAPLIPAAVGASDLQQTGLYARPGTLAAAPGVRSFSPQYPLWSDGATKRRWIALPPGSAIDASRPSAWEFPVGTRLWKEFAVDGRRVETRMLERVADGSWHFAAYAWNAEGTRATLVPADGLQVPLGQGRSYAIPAQTDCLACHEGAASPVLGFSALQLSPQRDPLAPHAEPRQPGDVDLRSLAEAQMLVGLPRSLLDVPPAISASSPEERAALGYLHGNCGHCHSDAGALPGLELVLAQQADAAARSSERTMQSLLGHSSRFRPQGADSAQRIARDGGTHVLTLRMKTNNPLARMPPLGVQQVDTEGVALVERWINQHLSNR
jgi:hypothetical protein